MNVREWALPVYTILMQLGVGTLLMLWIIRSFSKLKHGQEEIDRLIETPLLILSCTISAAIIGAHFHLSRPFMSILAVLNFRTSWLSREIIFTILFSLSLFGLVVLQRDPRGWARGQERLKTILGWISIGLGFSTVFCMSNIYLLEAQAAWNTPVTVISFGATTLLLGAVSLIVILLMDLRFSEVWRPEQLGPRPLIVRRALIGLAAVSLVMVIVVYMINYYQLVILLKGDETARTSLDLLTNLYKPLLIIRLAIPFVGIGWLMGAMIPILRERGDPSALIWPAYISCILVTVGEIMGRFLFYATHVRVGI